MLSFPVVLVTQLFFLGFWLVLKPRWAVVPALLLLVSFPFWPRTYKFKAGEEGSSRSDTPSIKVVNYNVASFFSYYENELVAEKVLEWLKGTDADVICFQEFANRKQEGRQSVIDQLTKAGYPYHAIMKITDEESSSFITGVVTFSKHPILSKQDSFFSGMNGVLQTDILWRGKQVRIINVHLYSMTLKLNKLANQKEYDGVKRETQGTFLRMKKGFEERNEEIDILESWIKDSAYPLIVCGDFNETPYGYVYGRMRRHLSNAFENQGNGFGFSYNKLPYFIRIDHQFYSNDKLDLQEFSTQRKVPYSDHYPLVATYTLEP
ncbi:endonuclease/exonuclease/phosphatase family protein [Telluribacter humicola]